MAIFLLIQVYILIVQTLTVESGGKDNGYYRCQWFSRHDAPGGDHPSSGEVMPPEIVTSNSQCLSQDSEKMTSFVNHCTGEKYVPLKICNSNGSWNCPSFISLCKTMIRTISPTQAPLQQQIRFQDIPAGPCLPDPARRFSLEEMGVAILVSFISGISLLAVVIIVVWKYKNTTTTTDCRDVHQNQESIRKHSSRVGVLRSIASVLGQRPESNNIVLNPNYDEVLTCSPASVVDDILMENERLYEEIILRRQSTCSQHNTIGECLYSKVNKIKQEQALNLRRKTGTDIHVAIPEEKSDVSGDVTDDHSVDKGKTSDQLSNGKRPSNVYETCFGDIRGSVGETGNTESVRENNDSGIYDIVPKHSADEV